MKDFGDWVKGMANSIEDGSYIGRPKIDYTEKAKQLQEKLGIKFSDQYNTNLAAALEAVFKEHVR